MGSHSDGGSGNGLSNGVLQEGVVCMGEGSGGVARAVQMWRGQCRCGEGSAGGVVAALGM